MTLENVYYLPHLAFTLTSVGTMDQNAYDLHIKEDKCIMQSPKTNVIGQIPLICGLYCVTEITRLLISAITNAAVNKMLISELH